MEREQQMAASAHASGVGYREPQTGFMQRVCRTFGIVLAVAVGIEGDSTVAVARGDVQGVRLCRHAARRPPDVDGTVLGVRVNPQPICAGRNRLSEPLRQRK
jgi:hypothetical protein